MSVSTRITLDEKGITELSQRLGEPDWMREKRLAALEVYNRLDLPQWDRTDLQGLDLSDLTFFEEPEVVDNTSDLPGPLQAAAEGEGENRNFALQAGSGKTFLSLQDDLKAKGVIVCDFPTAVREHGDIVKEHFMSAVPYDADKLTALHYAAWSSGWFVYVPKNTVIETPIELHTYTDKPGLSLFPHVLVVAEEASEVTIVERVGSQDGGVQRVVGEVVEIVPADGARVRYGALQTWDKETFNFTTRRSVIARDAGLEWLIGDFGGRLSRTHSTSVLEGQGSESQASIVFFGDESQHLDLGITMMHVGHHTSSDMETKGVLSDRARIVYRGLTDIENGARYTSGFQRENTMLLSEHARSDAIPGLEIDETEVQAGHAATVGQVDDVQLFYLMSRGLPEKEAIYLLVEGFFDPVLRRVPIEGLRNEMSELIGRKMA